MAFFQILGTGPSTPITNATGRNVRRRTSALMHYISTYLLLDATHDFEEQIEGALSVTAVVLSNLSRDAAGGLANLDRWCKEEVVLYAPQALFDGLNKRYGPFETIRHQAVEAHETVVAGDLKLTPFPVTTGSDALAFGYHMDTGKKRVCYVSDVKTLPEGSEKYLRGNDLLVIDGAGWDKDLPTHRGALNHLPDYADWGNERIIFTHIGRSAPPHAQATAMVRRMNYKADVAFDFMKLPLGR
jgi:phosphoribosyl 1,2-cyclic phosphodiesterase